jgi:hypothetical protein
MIRIEIKSTKTGEQDIAPKAPPARQFTPFTKISQSAYVHGLVDQNGSPHQFPLFINVMLGTKQSHVPAWPIGFYELEAESFFVDRFDSLSIGRLSLKAVQPQQLKAAA